MRITTKSLLIALCLAAVGQPARGENADTPSGAPAEWAEPIHDSRIFYLLLLEQLEYRRSFEGENEVGWIFSSWVGWDYDRLWLESEGELSLDEAQGELEALDVLYGRALSPFWDVQVGVGYQRSWGEGPDPDRFQAVLGLQGLAPQWFELEVNLRLSQDGDVSAALEAEYDLLLTQRLVLQPRLEATAAVQPVEAFGVGRWLNALQLGARLRYELRRELAPYVGIAWERRFGQTADFARAQGEAASGLRIVAGLRLWY